MTGNLTFAEVVGWVLDENQCGEESSLADLQGHCTRIRGELDDLIGTGRVESDTYTQKRLKREIDLRRKDIESLKVAIFHHQSNLGWGESGDTAPDDDNSSDHGAGEAMEPEMAIAPGTDDTPSVSAPEQSSDPPPIESQSHAMEVDDEPGDPPPASPISPVDDDLLTAWVLPTSKETWPTLWSRLLRTQMAVVRMPPLRRFRSTCLQDVSGKRMKLP